MEIQVKLADVLLLGLHRNGTNSTQNQQNVMRRDIPDLCSHEPISSSQKGES